MNANDKYLNENIPTIKTFLFVLLSLFCSSFFTAPDALEKFSVSYDGGLCPSDIFNLHINIPNHFNQDGRDFNAKNRVLRLYFPSGKLTNLKLNNFKLNPKLSTASQTILDYTGSFHESETSIKNPSISGNLLSKECEFILSLESRDAKNIIERRTIKKVKPKVISKDMTVLEAIALELLLEPGKAINGPQNIEIQGQLTVDIDYAFNYSTLVMTGESSKIFVAKEKDLSFDNGTIINGCGEKWTGISIDEKGRLFQLMGLSDIASIME